MAGHTSITWDDFAKLRLAQFIPASDVTALQDWEFMDRLWVGEAVGFSEWLRLRDDPQVLRSLALDLVSLDESTIGRVVKRLGLPLLPRMSREDVERALGEPSSVQVLPSARDRETLIYTSPALGGYEVSCTVAKATGLTYAVVMRGDWASPR